YNMLKLTRHLFQWKAEAEYADYYERALYNHVLASQNPDDGMMCYFIPMNMNAAKTYNTPFDSFWCCTGTGMENHAKYGDSIYFHHEDGLYVNLFIPSVLNWSEKGVQIWQQTRFPEEEEISLTFVCRRPVKLPLHIRRPFWARDSVQIRLNGNSLEAPSRPGSYITIERTWRNGDALQIAMPMTLRTEAMPDNPNRAAIFYGPILLAGDLGPIQEEESEQTRSPVFVTGNREVSQWIERDESKPLTFRTTGAGRPEDVVLKPFYQTHHRRYSVYWDFFTQEQWEKLQADYQAEQARLEQLNARTVDVMRIGEMQPERDHHLQGERTQTGDFMGRKWRHAHSGGWFSFDMKTGGNDPLELMCTYWGSDAGGRTFDILIDGVKIAEQTLQNHRPGKFFDAL
ncbi:MAG: beta-L-arabinofuranosidase domain-containing protein, partial [Candidatus Hinthialibacter sp.]